MEAVNFGFASGNYKTVDGIVYTTTGQLVYCPPAVKGEITIPEGVTEIEDSAFADCAGITAVHFRQHFRRSDHMRLKDATVLQRS